MHNSALLHAALQDDLQMTDGMLTSDMSPETANRLWLARSFWKKFQDDIAPTADAKCLKLFKESNERCAHFSWQPRSIQEEQVIGEVKNLFDSYFFSGPTRIPLSDFLDNTDIGPGASLGSESYNFYTKLFDSDLTGTSERLYRFYRYAIMSNPTWFRAEVARQDKFGNVIVAGNRLSFVPKTSEVSRSICTEPLLNMFMQKGIGHVLETVLYKRFSIDLSRQPDLNRRLARIGSVDGSFGTIDLSSASDSISLIMLRDLIPGYVLDLIELSRSPSVIFPDGTSVELHMVSSMGNAFTFPLQTLLFSSIVASCYRVLGIPLLKRRSGPDNFGVFGDDIIVRKDAYAFVARCLELFGFTVNDDKSFNSGGFRESCGGDYWRGLDIRGVYCKSLKTSADVYSIINRLIRWSSRTGILLPKTVSILRSWVDFLPIPFSDGDAEGIKTPVPPDGSRVNYNHQSVIYYALVKKADSLLMPRDAKELRRYHQSGRNIAYNPDGLVVSLVGGYIRNGRIGLRSRFDRFKVRRRSTSSWSGHFTAGVFHPESDWEVTFGLYFD